MHTLSWGRRGGGVCAWVGEGGRKMGGRESKGSKFFPIRVDPFSDRKQEVTKAVKFFPFNVDLFKGIWYAGMPAVVSLVKNGRKSTKCMKSP